MRVRKILVVASTFITLAFLLLSGKAQDWNKDFRLKEVWEFPDEKIGGYIYDSDISPNGDVIFWGFKWWIVKVNKKGISLLTPKGEGPGEVKSPFNFFITKDLIGVMETYGKISFFKIDKSSYKFLKFIFLKPSYQIKTSFFQCGGKFYVGGFLPASPGTLAKGYFLTVYDDKGKPIGKTLFLDFKKNSRIYLSRTFMRKYGNRLFVFLEFSPTVYWLNCGENNVKGKVSLKMPDFYVPMHKLPEPPKGVISRRKLQEIYETWEASYSRIEEIAIDGDYLILQIRTLKKPKFALLFYKLKDFSLKKFYFGMDRFLGTRNGLFYFFANGNPGFDDEADELKIKIYEEKAREKSRSY